MKIKGYFTAFHLKIIAIITMTVDHIGVLLLEPFLRNNGNLTIFYHCLRWIGRISFPLFAFLLVESVFHTRNRWKYLLRLGISAITMGGALALLQYGFDIYIGRMNIFMDLFLGAALLTTLLLPRFKKLFSLLPISIILCLLIFDASLPAYLCLEYHFYGIILILGFFGCRFFARFYQRMQANRVGIPPDDYETILPQQMVSNILAIIYLVILNLGYWAIVQVNKNWDMLNMSIQIGAILSGIAILFYNGKKGYGKVWFQYFCYLYYPLHLVILYMIYLIM